jgi:hypothetical protein
MDFPSENWVYNDWDDFNTAPPPSWWGTTPWRSSHKMFVHSLLPNNGVKGDCTLEIYDQLRPSGRILEHFRAILGGSKTTTGRETAH